MSKLNQAEIVRSNQKDGFYQAYLRGTLGDVIHSWLGARMWMRWRKELDLTSDLCYFGLTTLGGFQTLGEEYVNIVQVDPTRRAVPSALRRSLMIGLQVATPYFMDKLLTHAEKQLRSNPSLNLGPDVRQRLLAAIPVVRHVIMLTHRCHLAAFYLHGAYYHIAKRFAGINYLRVTNGPSSGSSLVYRVLGWLSFLQLSFALLQQLYVYYTGSWKGKQNTDAETTNGLARSEGVVSVSGERCPLCISMRTHTTVTPCGHLFCWPCIHEWCARKPECPLCRQPCESSRLLYLQNYDPT